jgi:hypothetical protein
MAMKNKMDLSVGIAIGSSLQIALFVAPVLIFLSYAFGRPMDLEFTLPKWSRSWSRFTSCFRSVATARRIGSKASNFCRSI